MEQLLKELISEVLYHIILSNPKEKTGITKIKVRPILLKEQLYFQETIYNGAQVFHDNYSKEEMIEKINAYMRADFRQLEAETANKKATVLVSKKGKITIKEKTIAGESKNINMSHNKAKKYILKEGEMIPFLVKLGVQTVEGKIINTKYDKFRQINRFLEFIEDILPTLPKDREINIIDFGCGKSYLTFAVYYYLHVLQGRLVQITGLDLKRDVIKSCTELAKESGYQGLSFKQGDISSFEGATQVDMVITLHACDTATDHAILKAIQWDAGVILSVPCCQHEVNGQIKNELMEPILKYGLLKERIAALVTDGIRANLLEEQGYHVQILEFIDMEHTPKNILIRAVKGKNRKKVDTGIKKMSEFMQINTTLQKLL